MPKSWGRWLNSGVMPLEGGQGRIYIVKDSKEQYLGEWALKELKNIKRTNRFEREIEAIARLDNTPGVVRVIDSVAFASDSPKPYFVMEKAEGALSDKSIIDSLDFETALSWFGTIAKTVISIHDRGIVHRDIKPENILLFDGEPKVSDLGICLLCNEQRLTHSREAVGSRYYMAPELEDGFHLDVDFRADYYSLGKLLYFLLSRTPIFSRERFGDRKHNLKHFYDDQRFDLFDSFFQRTIVESPNQRYKSSKELLDGFYEASEAFLCHPRTTLYEKLGKHAVSVSEEQLSDIVQGEISELLELVVSRKLSITSEALIELTRQATSKTVRNLTSCLFRERDRFTSLEQETICRNLILQDPEVAKQALSIFDGSSEYLAAVALDTRDVSLVERIAEFAIPHLLAKREIAGRISSYAKELSASSRVHFLVSIMRVNEDWKQAIFLSMSNHTELSDLEFEVIVWGLASCNSEDSFSTLCRLAVTATSESRLEAFLRGIARGSSTSELSMRLSMALAHQDSHISRLLSKISEIQHATNKEKVE